MAGTLLGSVVTYVFQKRSVELAQEFSLQQQLRSERMIVYSDFAGAVTEYRRAQHDWWHIRNEQHDSPASFDARVEAYRLRGLAQHALPRIELVTIDPEVTDAARRVFEVTRGQHRATTANDLEAFGAKAILGLEDFVVLAASDIRREIARNLKRRLQQN